MKSFKLIGCVCMLMFSTSLVAQDQFVSEQSNKGMEAFPGYNPKLINKNKDFSNQLSELNKLVQSNQKFDKKDFWVQYEIEGSVPSADELNDDQMKVITDLKKFYDKMDAKVQEAFSLSDLWHIYLHDEELANQLQKI